MGVCCSELSSNLGHYNYNNNDNNDNNNTHLSSYRGFLMYTIFAPVHPVLSKQNAPRRHPYGRHLWGGAFNNGYLVYRFGLQTPNQCLAPELEEDVSWWVRI